MEGFKMLLNSLEMADGSLASPIQPNPNVNFNVFYGLIVLMLLFAILAGFVVKKKLILLNRRFNLVLQASLGFSVIYNILMIKNRELVIWSLFWFISGIIASIVSELFLTKYHNRVFFIIFHY